jgi:hypothetical protein
MPEKTKYQVLRLDRPEVRSDDQARATPETWTVYARDVEAHSSSDAIRQTVKADGMYAAVPSRSFTPTSVKLETTTTVKLGAAGA